MNENQTIPSTAQITKEVERKRHPVGNNSRHHIEEHLGAAEEDGFVKR